MKNFSFYRSSKFWAFTIWIIFAISMIPLLWIAIYNHGYVDDYWYGELTHKAWLYDHSIIAVVKAVVTTVKNEYIRWQAYGEDGPGRIQNIRFYFFILLGVLTEYLLISVLIQNLKKDGKESLIQYIKNKFHRNSAFVLVIFLVVLAYLVGNYVFFGNANEITTISAIKSLHNGEAKEYDRQMDERTALYLSDSPTVKVKKVTVKPHMLYFSDISKDAGNWKNQFMARYFEKESVVLIKE